MIEFLTNVILGGLSFIIPVGALSVLAYYSIDFVKGRIH